MKHTPGPLTVRYYQPTPQFAAIPEHVCAAQPDGTPVAFCGPTGDPQNEADARLFAAAPELEDAAEKARHFLESFDARSFFAEMHPDLWHATDGVIVALRAALAKARGED